MTSSPRPRILLVDDEPHVLSALRRALRREPWEVVTATAADEALQQLATQAFAAVLTDQNMPGMQGVELLQQARALAPDTMRLVLTGYVDTQVAIDAINQGAAHRFLTKPWQDEELRQALRQAVERAELVQENRRLVELTRQQNDILLRLNQDLMASRRQEADIGARIQKTLLQSGIEPPVSGEWDAAALSVGSLQIDGDFYDFFVNGPDSFDLVVGDVMGKGIAAALLGVATKARLVRSLAALPRPRTPSPAEVVNEVHRQTTPELVSLGSFVTLCYARFDLAQQCLTFVDCGHTPLLHLRRDTLSCVQLKGDNVPLGFSADESYEQHCVPFGPGDRFLLYSDGVTEARAADGSLFGQERLERLLAQHSRASARAVIDQIRYEVAAFVGDDSLSDDLTCLLVAIAEPPRNLDLDAALGELAGLRDQIADFAAATWGDEVDATRLAGLQLAANEAFVNVVEHALEGQPGARVQVDLRAVGNRAIVRLRHGGRAFNRQAAPQPSFDGSRDRGFGLYIIDQAVDGVDYGHAGPVQSITIWHALTPPPRR